MSLLAVSKTKPSELVREAYKSGLTAFGENYAQEMDEKARDLTDLPLSWHFIGPIQSNKTAIIAEVRHVQPRHVTAHHIADEGHEVLVARATRAIIINFDAGNRHVVDVGKD